MNDIMKYGHELLCGCGQRLDAQGVCISCNPPEELEDDETGQEEQRNSRGELKELDFNVDKPTEWVRDEHWDPDYLDFGYHELRGE